MADVFWTLNFHMKDAPSGEKFLEERMDQDLICYFDIIGIIEKHGYTSMDYLYCRRNVHGRRQSKMVELVQITSDLDVSRMVCEHEDDQKLSFYVTKQTDPLNTGVRPSKQVHTGATADAERRQAVSDEGVNGSGYDTEASHETDCEAERVDQQAGLEAMKRRRVDPNVNWKMHKKHRQENLRFDLEDEDSAEEDEDNLQDSREHADEEEDPQDILEHDTTLLSASKEPAGSTEFVYAEPTKDNTEAWILRIVNKRWRDYKSFLKNKYYNPTERSLEQIKKQVPPGVNRHQWTALLGIWCQEQHLVMYMFFYSCDPKYPRSVSTNQTCNVQRTCNRNSESAKQQRHPHTTGRKSHARLRKQMEDENGGPVNKIDLWDEAHKRKDGKYTNEDVQKLMHKARKELAARKKKGTLSTKDYDEVFDDVIAKESTIGGYKSAKYWDNTKLHQGSTSAGPSPSEMRVQNELQSLKRDFKNVTGLATRMLAFMEQKYPNEDWMSEMLVMQNENEVNVSGEVGDGATPNELDNVDKSMGNKAQFAHHIPSKELLEKSSLPHEKTTVMASTQEEQPTNQSSEQINISERVSDGVIQHDANNNVGSYDNVHTSKDNSKRPNVSYHAKSKEQSVNSSPSHEQSFMQASKTVESPKHQIAKKKQKTVILLSMNSRNKGQVVAKGIIKSRDSEYMVGGDKLGDVFYGITIQAVSQLGHEKLPRPYGDVRNVEDAIGHCIAWPCTHVKRIKDTSN